MRPPRCVHTPDLTYVLYLYLANCTLSHESCLTYILSNCPGGVFLSSSCSIDVYACTRGGLYPLHIYNLHWWQFILMSIRLMLHKCNFAFECIYQTVTGHMRLTVHQARYTVRKLESKSSPSVSSHVAMIL